MGRLIMSGWYGAPLAENEQGFGLPPTPETSTKGDYSTLESIYIPTSKFLGDHWLILVIISVFVLFAFLVVRLNIKTHAQRLGCVSLAAAVVCMILQLLVFFIAGRCYDSYDVVDFFLSNLDQCVALVGGGGSEYRHCPIFRTLFYPNALWIVLSLIFAMVGNKLIRYWQRIVSWVNEGS
jgi:hypothetical protein